MLMGSVSAPIPHRILALSQASSIQATKLSSTVRVHDTRGKLRCSIGAESPNKVRERCPSHPTKHSLRLKSPTRNSSVSPPRNEPRKLSPDDEAFFSFLPLAQFRAGSQVGTRTLGGTVVMGTRTARRRVSPVERRQLSQEGSHLRQTSHPSTYRRLLSKVAVQNSIARGL
ncbi:hypothetical protein V8C43DRAFT_315547 [Trichoderma afarasin]